MKREPALHDGLLVDRRGDEGVEFLAQAAFGSVLEPRHGRLGRSRGTFHQFRRQGFGERLMDENPAGLAGSAVARQREIQGQLMVEPPHLGFVPDEEVLGAGRARFDGERLERASGPTPVMSPKEMPIRICVEARGSGAERGGHGCPPPSTGGPSSGQK